MANVNVRTHSTGVFAVLGAALMWVWDGLVFLGENSARARVLRQIGNMSDEQLEACGMTRAEVIQRVLSDGYQM